MNGNNKKLHSALSLNLIKTFSPIYIGKVKVNLKSVRINFDIVNNTFYYFITVSNCDWIIKRHIVQKLQSYANDFPLCPIIVIL
jgi:hypothetical protein